MNLTIDIGNTTTKIGVFDEDKLVCFQRHEGYALANIKNIVHTYPIDACIISSTGKENDELEKDLADIGCKQILLLSHTTPVPIINKYKSPETLGMDRLAAVVGAYNEMPDKDILIIDAGTAITYDLLTAQGEYLGGNISPGIELRFRALHEFTAKLPLVNQNYSLEDNSTIPNQMSIGTNTFSAIKMGVIDGIKYEIEGFIRSFITKYPHLLVFLTGGNAFDFDSTIKKRIFADKYLVLKGLNRILKEQTYHNGKH